MTITTDKPTRIADVRKARRTLSPEPSKPGTFPTAAFAAPADGHESDDLTAERDGIIESALYLATAAIDNDPQVRRLQKQLHDLADRVRKSIEIGPVTDGSDEQLAGDIEDMAQDLPLAAAQCMAYAWLADKGSVLIDRRALLDFYNRSVAADELFERLLPR